MTDSRAHQVPDSEMCSDRATRSGRYEALCGHLVTPVPLVEERSGVPCERCATRAAALERDDTGEDRKRRRRGLRGRRRGQPA
ncbi:hypothetical protein [Pseudonocardia phyllosphaerae]|uniref:hypothetical protein n=1 Tax=Pseudonocardia phyllosphaerae TaxID=3390502 RepID=UPI003978D730